MILPRASNLTPVFSARSDRLTQSRSEIYQYRGAFATSPQHQFGVTVVLQIYAPA
ncbi:hypothetical protein CAMGR0001_1378 [Campylobacter gracilis RM3268]|uniref:Uncharacterized protein n=1 Tax=Campylobacter gracilis RM3268 TaxID=553220 RepID=C8PJH8_9BACT|nr:hypothetical protein CAMGR0001_1378 [Campylobacter gracilis RM3268]